MHDSFFIPVNVSNAIGQTRKGFTEVLLEPNVDHMPTRYAIHIRNNIDQEGK